MLGTIVAKRRKQVGLSQEKLAEQVGISRGTIAQLETGIINWPRLDTLQRIADALQTTIPWLLREAGIVPAVDEELEREIAELVEQVPEFAEWFDVAREIAKRDPSKLRELVRHGKWLLEEEKRETAGMT